MIDYSLMGLSPLTSEETKIAEEDYEHALNELRDGKVSFYDQFANIIDTFKGEHPKIWINLKIFGLFCGTVAAISAWQNYVIDAALDQDNTYTVSSFSSSVPYITIGNGTDTFDLSADGSKVYLNFDLTNNTIVNESCEGKEKIDVYLNFGDSTITPTNAEEIGATGYLYKTTLYCWIKKVHLTGV